MGNHGVPSGALTHSHSDVRTHSSRPASRFSLAGPHHLHTPTLAAEGAPRSPLLLFPLWLHPSLQTLVLIFPPPPPD